MKKFNVLPKRESRTGINVSRLQPTWEESVALLTHHYIPKDEIPFLMQLDPSTSRICGGWVQALPHVSQSSAEFEQTLLPAARALALAMSVTDPSGRQEYLDTYGDALRGVRAVLATSINLIDNTLAIASMCLTLSEVRHSRCIPDVYIVLTNNRFLYQRQVTVG